MCLSKLQKLIPPQLTSALWSFLRLWPMKNKEIKEFFNTIEHFTNAHSIHSGFYQRRMIDDNQKIVIPHLAIDIDFFHSAFVNPCMMYCKTKDAVRAVRALLRICPLSAQWAITV
jgi:hypothetical protein